MARTKRTLDTRIARLQIQCPEAVYAITRGALKCCSLLAYADAQFESNILDATFLPDWKPTQEAWRTRVGKAKRVSELAQCLLQLDVRVSFRFWRDLTAMQEKILPAKYSDSWLNSKQKSWRTKLTVQSPPESPAIDGFSLPMLMNRSTFAPQFAYA